MSVINKMLRDLDQRQSPAAEGTAAVPENALRSVTSGLAAVPRGVPAGTGNSGWWSQPVLLAGLLLGAVVLASALWWVFAHEQAGPAAPMARVRVAAPASSPSAALPVPAAAMEVQSAANLNTGANASTQVTLPASAPSAVAVAQVKAATASAPSGLAVANPGTPKGQAVAATLAPPGTIATAASYAAPQPAVLQTAASATNATNATYATNATNATNADPQATLARQAQAGREALAQAQALWASGAQDAATELLQQALVMAQHATSTNPAATNGPLLASLARELARMQLAEGRASAALETLTRLEPVLGREAEVWAMRGNAAQRLGRHQDSVQAYTTALQLRPGEQRWLLGSAVSLAALGQLGRAADMMDKARALGPISKEVQAYLRQAGVPSGEP